VAYSWRCLVCGQLALLVYAYGEAEHCVRKLVVEQSCSPQCGLEAKREIGSDPRFQCLSHGQT
jgi:hypothetical protein